MNRRIREVVRLLPKLLFLPPPSNSDATSDDEDEIVKDKVLVEQLAQEVNLSASRLRALFKADMKMTLQQYIKKLRIEKAKELAETTYLPMDRIISDIVRAGDLSHFRRGFKKAYGMTLTECRELCDGRTEEESGEENNTKQSPQSKRPASSQNGPQIVKLALVGFESGTILSLFAMMV